MTRDKILGKGLTLSTDVPEAVSFDGTNDYLSRSTDLVGASDGKTFTFSCWIYGTEYSTVNSYIFNGKFRIGLSGGMFYMYAEPIDSGTASFGVNATIKEDTWWHLLVSVDVSDINKRHCLINEAIPNDLSWYKYDNTVMDLHSNFHAVNTSGNFKGRFSNLFFDYTYRDLSIEANRRLFTVEGKPASGSILQALNPILYLPMTDKATCHQNLGTGGDFVQNGLIETADRGANQDNCVMSEFDGVDDYLSSAGIGASDSKTITASFVIKMTDKPHQYIFASLVDGASFFTVSSQDGNFFEINSYANSTGILECSNYSNNQTYVGQTIHVTFSLDMSNENKRHFYINGKEIIFNYGKYIDAPLKINCPIYNIGTWNSDVSYCINSSIGELYFSTEYIDLATSNPFWNSDTNRPIPVRKAMETLGSNPLICMPISADNPTKNYGSGGDFTLNGGGLKGARGMSEFISRSILASNGSSDFLSLIGDGSIFKKMSLVVAISSIDGTVHYGFITGNGVTNRELAININNTSSFSIKDSSGNTEVVGSNLPTNIDNFNILFLCANWETGVWHGYMNGASRNGTMSTTVGLLNSQFRVGEGYGVDCSVAQTYFTNEYIDFSQESNRNLFVNQLGYPRDLKQLIDNGDIPNPLIYLPFDDTSNLGKNLGTGGDFTVNGSVISGADFAL